MFRVICSRRTASNLGVLLPLMFGLVAGAQTTNEIVAGPLFSKFNLTLEPGQRTEAAGPLYYNERQEEIHTWGIPPLMAFSERPAIQAKELEFIYPVLTYNRYGGQYRFQFCQLFSFAGGETMQEKQRGRFTIFPIYFQQRTSNPKDNYTAFVPFYGHLRHRLFHDDIRFVMFPAYSKSLKGGVVTWTYLYPFFHIRRGNGVRGWQVFPFINHETKRVTTTTNLFHEVETVGGSRKLVLMWPFFFNQHTGLGTTNQAWQQAFIPAYSLMRSPEEDSTTVLWPFFSHINNKQKGYHEWDAPWPLVEFARGPGKHTSRVWPFYSHAYNTNLEDDFYLWPVWKYNRVHADPLDRRRKRILFFLYSDTTEKNTHTGKFNERIDMWPLFSHYRDFNGNTRLQILAPLDPLFPGQPKIQREYAPAWSIWRSEHNAQTGASSQSLLWNLYRRDVRPHSSRLSFLFGLFQLRRDAHGRQLRLFYFPLTIRRVDARRRGDLTLKRGRD